MKITRFEGDLLPLVWAVSIAAEIEAEIAQAASPTPAPTLPDDLPREGLMTLQDAAWLPELGGVITIKTLRAAIRRGDIDAIQPAGKGGAVYVTRAAIIAWIDQCLVQLNHPASTSDLPESKTVQSVRMRRGSSSMPEKRKALDAALKIAQALKQR